MMVWEHVTWGTATAIVAIALCLAMVKGCELSEVSTQARDAQRNDLAMACVVNGGSWVIVDNEYACIGGRSKP